jgi:fructose-specific component phosphotransferase system IIB-like protein
VSTPPLNTTSIRELLTEEAGLAQASMPPADQIIRAAIRRRRRRAIAASSAALAILVVGTGTIITLATGIDNRTQQVATAPVAFPRWAEPGPPGYLSIGASAALNVSDKGCPYIDVADARAGAWPAGRYVLLNEDPVVSATLERVDSQWLVKNSDGKIVITQGEAITTRPLPNAIDYQAQAGPCDELFDDGALPSAFSLPAK